MRRPSSWLTHGTSVLGLVALVSSPALLRSQTQGQGQGQSGGQTVIVRPPTGPIEVRFGTQPVPRAPRRLADVPLTIPQDNPLTDAKVALGRRLFFDPVLSNDRSVSCSTCHAPDRAFTDTNVLAVGVFGRVGRRHSPSLINRVYGRSQFWDGRIATLEAQVLQPIQDPNEMDLTLEKAIERLNADASYRTAFTAAFERPISNDDLGRALASYLRTIRSSDSPYDKFIDGDQAALSADEQRGLQMFRGKGRCTICHAEPLFTDEALQNTGVAYRVDPTTGAGAYLDDGRFKVTNVERDRGKFKVPTLREIANTAPYMHDGSLSTLAAVVDFYDGGGRPNPNLFPLVRPINFAPDEKLALIAFLKTLSGTVTGK